MAQSKINELEFPGGGGYQLSSSPGSGKGKLMLFPLIKKTSSLSAPSQSVSSLSLSGDATKCKLKHLNLLRAHEQVRVASSSSGLGSFQPGWMWVHRDRSPLSRHPRAWQGHPQPSCTCTAPEEAVTPCAGKAALPSPGHCRPFPWNHTNFRAGKAL